MRMKIKVHAIYKTAIKRRKERSLKLYRRLSGGRYKQYITTDEAWFYLSNFKREKNTFYSKIGLRQRTPTRRPLQHSKGLMAWAGICSRGRTKLRWVDVGAKVDAKYYIDRVLKPFLKKDAPSLYPEGNFIFHQDSAPAHRAAITQDFLSDRGINFIKADEWIPCSPDASPMDFGVWSWMKSRLKYKKVRTLLGLKKAVQKVWTELPQNLIDNVLKSWPKRVYQIYKAKGFQIEHLRKKKSH